MRTFFMLLKLALVLAVVNASARVGYATWQNYELKEAAQKSVLFGRQRPAEELLAGVLAKAEELRLPLTADQVSVHQRDAMTVIDVAYVNTVEVFPNQKYDMKFAFSVEGFNAMAR